MGVKKDKGKFNRPVWAVVNAWENDIPDIRRFWRSGHALNIMHVCLLTTKRTKAFLMSGIDGSFGQGYLHALNTSRGKCEMCSDYRHKAKAGLGPWWCWTFRVISESLIARCSFIWSITRCFNCLLYTSPSPRDA